MRCAEKVLWFFGNIDILLLVYNPSFEFLTFHVAWLDGSSYSSVACFSVGLQ